MSALVPPWMVLPAGLLAWIALLWIVTRLVYRGHERIRCPLTGQIAYVTFVRGPDGSREEVVRCSLRRPLTCGRPCRSTT